MCCKRRKSLAACLTGSDTIDAGTLPATTLRRSLSSRVSWSAGKYCCSAGMFDNTNRVSTESWKATQTPNTANAGKTHQNAVSSP